MKRRRTQHQYDFMRRPVKLSRPHSLRPQGARSREFWPSCLKIGEWSRGRSRYGRVGHRESRRLAHKLERRYHKSLCRHWEEA